MAMSILKQGLLAAQILQRLWPLVMELYESDCDRTEITREDLLEALRNSKLGADRAEDRLQETIDKAKEDEDA